MNKIDTEYKSLNQIDPEIVRFYEEETRERITGYTEQDEDGYSTPITEEYLVVVLNKPEEVSFEYVESRRGRRLGEEVAKAALVQAIAWNDFTVNHDGYLSWLDAYSAWEDEQPTELVGEEEVLVPAPERPVIDMADRRDVYEALSQSYDTNLFHHTEELVEYDDDAFTATAIPVLIDNDPADVAAYHAALAKVARDEALTSNIEVFGVMWQVRIKDRDNINEAINKGIRNQLSGSETRYWILADNSVRETTLEELGQIMDAYTARMDDIYFQYGTWRSGDQLTPFIYE